MQNLIDHDRAKTQNKHCVYPFISDPLENLYLKHYQIGDTGRGRVKQMIQELFAATYEAELSYYCDDLIALETSTELLGAVGLRLGNDSSALFSEQYLDESVDTLICAHTGQGIARNRIVEIGNLAVNGTGQTRWLFAVMTAFLHSAGYDWVVCTAISPLINIFKRVGLNPEVLGDADPARLAGDAESWGRYYDLEPKICFGSIEAGYQKMSSAITSKHPRLQALWRDAHAAGMAYANQNSHHEVRVRP
ncbi:MAG: hypothetical protein GWO88_00840 [Planctomycetia bacterium]|nr:hypothetical protein [Planctomycetia bacterium]